MIRVLIAGNILWVRDRIHMSLKVDPDIEIIGTVTNGLQAVAESIKRNPDVVLMNIKMPIMDGFEAAQHIRESNRTIRVIILTPYAEPENIRMAKKCQCCGLISTEDRLENLSPVIKNVYNGFSVWSRGLLYMDERNVRCTEWNINDRELSCLNKKELMLIKCKVRCLTYNEIAKELNYSEAYVRQLAVQLKDKLGLQSVPELAIWGAKRGL